MSKRKEVREAILALLDAGKKPTEISKEVGCSRHVAYTVKKLKTNRKKLGTCQNTEKKRWVLAPATSARIKRRIKNAKNVLQAF